MFYYSRSIYPVSFKNFRLTVPEKRRKGEGGPLKTGKKEVKRQEKKNWRKLTKEEKKRGKPSDRDMGVISLG